jgi:hypothetical protein
MKRFNVVLAVSVAVLIGIVGCKPKQEAPAPVSQEQPQLGDPVSGKIVETMNSAGYTYVCLEKSGKKTWVAMPQTKVKVGQEVSCQPGMVMPNFTSKTLKRTFESVVFSPGLI